jgi:hypothetical protein
VRCILCQVVRGGCALPGVDMQKPYASKCGQGKTKIDLFRDFYKNHLNQSYEFLFQLEFPHRILWTVYNVQFCQCRGYRY